MSTPCSGARLRRWVSAALLVGPAIASSQPPSLLPDGDGKALVERICAQCHSLDTVVRSRRTRPQWAAEIDKMIAKGAKLSDEDIDVVADYLATQFGVPLRD